MTEKDIAKSINTHSVKPIIGLAILILILKIINIYFFENDPISPILIIIFSIGGCMYIFQKVLVDLLVTVKGTVSTKE
ncbi:hypothetical protein [Thalassotalea sp. ND16A]|uniref:hypothetical protein n=1 Tax=Thalassotalea sp. ND16A TaxID=1535422 RepID=UPI00051A186D|nr:hypothetical protein [Thalassotalea sp. ND16A]KGK01639.1 hypothetical protein ND16A_2923 [Thalassotalea sp. ND16A]